MRHFYVILFLTISCHSVSGQGIFSVSDNIRKAYEATTSLKMAEARIYLDQAKKESPHNLMILYIEDYIDFFTIFINEDKAEFDRLKVNKDIRLKKIEAGDKGSPFYLFCQAEVNLHWALARFKFDDRFAAGKEVYNAYRQLKENEKKFPAFMENKKSLSIMHALAESVPGILRKIFSIEGSIEQGTQEITAFKEYAEKTNSLFKDEATVILAYILFYQNNKKEAAWSVLNTDDLAVDSNPLLCFVKSNIAQKMGKNDLAISILENRPQGQAYNAFHYLDFLIGKNKLYRLDTDADVYIKKFIDQFKGTHFIKEAYQKLAWYELIINEDLAAYKYYMKLCLSEGNALTDEDRQAEKEAKNKRIPHPDLLKARLLYDGGYYQRAYSTLIKKSHLFITADVYKNEYHYRMGRITHALKNYPDAIAYYARVLNEGKESKAYFVCNAALQIGLILEDQKKHIQAKDYFKRCLDMKPEEYRRSLHQKAKSGLQRVEKMLALDQQ